uniref:Zyg-11 family member, cell cycle regulator n=1 Tax=Lates calcarifer TaxID=8187 RepID=A0A4W6CZM8_LATCA
MACSFLNTDEASPAALTDLCLTYVSQNLECFCVKRPDGSLCFREAVLFPQELADQLLAKMATEGLLNDSTVGVFRNCEYLRLRRACIRTARISAEAFQKALCPHRLLELDAARVNADLTIHDILQGLATNKYCQESLQRLGLTGLTMSSLEEPIRYCFSSLQGLRSLSLANVDFYDSGLVDVCSLPRLESLDLSNTSVTNLSPLLGLKERLRSLTLHQLKRLEMSTAQLELNVALCHLDISDDKQFTSDVARQLLGQPGILPALVSLDVSGRKQVTDAAVKAFVKERPGMTFVGLLATDAGFSDFLSGEGNLKVTGEANETQICEALRRYSEREGFVREALFHLFSLTHVMEKPRPDILKLVVLGMKNHPATLNVQLAASACVFNLTKQDLAAGMPVRLLSTVTQLLLEAMRTFPNHQQLQKNCLLSLCSDRILQEVPFNRFEAAKLVMQWLCNHEDQNMQRMAVAIISILAAKVQYIKYSLSALQQLLHIVRQKANQGVVDATLKFTLSALWNLTDESPTTCRHFIENQGLDLFIKVLESFPNESSIQQKVLGLLNNIAEVGELHGELMVQGFLDHISTLLHSPEVEVSYFAAGILAHLTSRGEDAWTLSPDLRSSLLEQLHAVITKWPPPECEMVAYRSFNPFFPLLECFHTPGVQLWAAWAMQHVCSKNAARYCSMLLEEGGLQQLERVHTHPQTHRDVKRLAESILDSLQRHRARTGQPRLRNSLHTH